MGRRGPLPTPIEMRNAQGGTPGKGAVRHVPMKKPVVLGQRVVTKTDIVPTFALPPEGQKMWDKYVNILISYNAATELDAPNLTVMCMFWADLIALNAAIKEDGRYDFGSTGQIRRSPLVADRNEAAKEFSRLSAQFGMTLDARTRLELNNVTTRSIESDLNARLGVNPRRTNRAITTGKKQIEKE